MLICIAVPVFGQDAISAKSGMVNYFEGKVLLNGEPLAYDRARFPPIPEGGTLEATEQGRAEVMLSPGLLMWVGEGAKVQLVSDSLLKSQVRVLAGSVVISGTEFTDDMSLTILVNDDAVEIRKSGIYRFDAAPASLYVYDGEATVMRADGETKVKKGRTLALSQSEDALAKFDKDETNTLLAWAQSRDSQIQVANLSSARAVASGGLPMGAFNTMGTLGYWLYNPYFGMYTFVPTNRMMMSPFGYYYLNPANVNNYYSNYYAYGNAGAGNSRRGAVQNTGSGRGGFGAESGGFGGYSRGASSMGRIGYDGERSLGSSGGGYSRGSSSMGSVSGGGAGSSAPTSSGGASMGRGGSSAGRGGGGGGRN
ncbi:MAG: hypothetical protein U5J83_02835 [Bryobacterales bacterium]|nr:hypothetical protein [Bryobacterales bacterium]